MKVRWEAALAGKVYERYEAREELSSCRTENKEIRNQRAEAMSELQAQRARLTEEEASLRSDAFNQRLVQKEVETESRALVFSEKAELTVQFKQAEAHIKAQSIGYLEAA